MRFDQRDRGGWTPEAALRAAARRTRAALFTALAIIAAGIAVANVAAFGAEEGGSGSVALAGLGVAIVSGAVAHRARAEG
jgi:multidrug efflux pump subunit AcrB